MTKISGQFLISGQFQKISGISGFQDNWEPCYYYYYYYYYKNDNNNSRNNVNVM